MLLEEDRQLYVEEKEETVTHMSPDGSDTDTASENSQTSTVLQSSKLCQTNIRPSTRHTRRIQVKPSQEHAGVQALIISVQICIKLKLTLRQLEMCPIWPAVTPQHYLS